MRSIWIRALRRFTWANGSGTSETATASPSEATDSSNWRARRTPETISKCRQLIFRYEGEWHNNKKHGYGVTTFRDGTKEEGKYKYNVLITSQKKKHLFLIRSAKFRERIEAGVSSSQRASKYALQKADIAVSRTATARGKAEMADSVADHARVDSEIAVATAREFAPDFKPNVLDRLDRISFRERFRAPSAEPAPSHHRPPLEHSATVGASPSHTTIQASVESTPQKQSSFQQGPIRRTSMLQKQASVDYPAGSPPNMSDSGMVGGTQSQMAQVMSPSNQSSGYNSGPMMNSGPPQQRMYDQQYQPQSQMSQQQQQHQMPQYQHSYNDPSMPNQNFSNYMNQTPTQGQGQYMDQYGNSLPPNQHSFNNTQSNFYGQTQMPNPQMYSPGSSAYSPSPYTNQSSQSYPNYNLASNTNQMSQGYNQQPNQMQSQQQKMYDDQLRQQQSPMQDQQQQQQNQEGAGSSNLRRNSRQVNENCRPPQLGTFAQTSIDHFDHYKRPPSRDSSVDRYARAASRLSGSRQPSIDRTGGNTNAQPVETPLDRGVRAGSAFRSIGATAPAPTTSAGNGSVMTGMGALQRSNTPSMATQPVYSSPNQPFEDVLLRQRTLGQDIIPSPREPKRTESLYLPPKPAPAANVGAAAKGKLKVSKVFQVGHTSFGFRGE